MGSLRVNSALGVSHVTLLFALACGDTSDATVIDASVDSTNDVVTDGPHAPPGCDLKADPKDSLACVDGSVGVFVDSAGKDSNDGSKANPVATLKAAFLLASQKGLPRVYVCEGNYSESATMSSSVSIYGGFKCGTWSYTGSKPKFAGTKSDYVLKLDGVNGVTVEDMEFDAKDGSMPGESSIAMFVNASMGVTLSRMSAFGGAGVKGADGTTTNYSFPSLNGNNASGDNGGAAKTVNCPGGDTSVGGKGGDVQAVRTGDMGTPNLGGGKAGAGDTSCNAGGGGGDGSNGKTGAAGGAATTYGTLSTSWIPSGADAGAPGTAGQGGGGGGAHFIDVNTHGGGGSGGAGGCGGAGGTGGQGGGSSFAVVSASSALTFANCTISTKAAGGGGAGVNGQTGQNPGGLGGLQVAPGCPGGGGGNGGNGGAGGGGAGGLSVGVFYKGTPPTVDMATSGAITLGTAGQGGAGGASNKGVDGIAAPVAECKSPLCN